MRLAGLGILFVAACADQPGGAPDSSTDSPVDAATDAPPPHPFTVGVQEGAPWPLLGGTSGRLGRSAATGPASNHLRWKYNLGAPVLLASPVIAKDGTVYIGATNGRFVALDPTGSLKWEVDLPAAVETTPVIGLDGTIYVGANDASLSAISPSGQTLRTAIATSSIRGGLNVDGDGIVYFAQSGYGGGTWWPDGTLHAAGGGAYVLIVPGLFCAGLCWTSSPPDTASVKILPDNIQPLALEENGDGFGARSQALVSFRSDGSVVWSASGIPDGSAPTYTLAQLAADAKGAVTGTDGYQTVVRFDDTGAFAWRYTVPPSYAPGIEGLTAPIVDAVDTSYFGVYDGRVLAIDTTGTSVWTFTTGNRVSPLAMGGDGAVYAASADGFVYAIGP